MRCECDVGVSCCQAGRAFIWWSRVSLGGGEIIGAIGDMFGLVTGAFVRGQTFHQILGGTR